MFISHIVTILFFVALFFNVPDDEWVYYILNKIDFKPKNWLVGLSFLFCLLYSLFVTGKCWVKCVPAEFINRKKQDTREAVRART
jgi:hypothetical protein